MKKYLLITLIIFCLSSRGQQWLWAYNLSTNFGSGIRASKSDVKGNCYILESSYSSDTNIFVGTNGTLPIYQTGAHVVKYDAWGNIKWISPGKGISIESQDMDVDAQGNIFLTGTFGTSARFGVGADTINQTAFQSSREIYFVKLDSNGRAVFFKKDGQNCYNHGMSSTVGANNEVILGWVDQTACGQNGTDTAYLEKFDNTGNKVWSIRPPLAHYYLGLYPDEIATTKDNGFLLSGYWFTYPLTLSGISNTMSLTAPAGANGEPDFFLAKYSLTGNVLWAKAIRGKKMQGDRKITVDNSNNILIAIMSYDTCYLDNNVFYPLCDRTNHVIKTDSVGNLIKYISFPDAFQDTCPGHFSIKDMETDRHGNIYLLGIPDTAITVGTTMIHFNNKNSLTVIKLDANLNYVWSQSAYQTDSWASWLGSIAVTDSVVFVAAGYNSSVILNGSNYQFPPPKKSTTYDSFFAAIKNGSTPTSIRESSQSDLNANAFPNPSTGAITIQTNDVNNVLIHVYDILGNCVVEKRCHGAINQVDMSLESKGVYFIKIETGRGTVQKKLIVH